MTKKWCAYMNDFIAFDYWFEFPVNLDDYCEKITLFDSFFILKGFEKKLFRLDSNIEGKIEISELVENYQKIKNVDFFESSNEYKFLNLLEFDNRLFVEGVETIKVYLNHVQSENISHIGDVFDYGNAHQIFRIINLGISRELNELELTKTVKVNMALTSHSNVWYEELEFTCKESDILRLADDPIDNRNLAYTITPILNSFLRDLGKLTESLGGKWFLVEGNPEHATEKGLLLDGKLIYSEDIDNILSSRMT